MINTRTVAIGGFQVCVLLVCGCHPRAVDNRFPENVYYECGLEKGPYIGGCSAALKGERFVWQMFQVSLRDGQWYELGGFECQLGQEGRGLYELRCPDGIVGTVELLYDEIVVDFVEESGTHNRHRMSKQPPDLDQWRRRWEEWGGSTVDEFYRVQEGVAASQPATRG